MSACLWAGTANAACTVTHVGTAPLTIEGTRLYVPVSMNETVGSFLLDTGAETSLLGGDYAARAHVGIDRHAGQSMFSGAGGRTTLLVNNAHVRFLEIAKIPFQDWEFAVVPPESGGLNKSEHDGILGMDFFHYFDIDLDLQAGTVNLWRLTGCKEIHPEWTGDYDAIPLTHTAHHNVTMPIMIDDVLLNVLFDTGASGLLLSRDAAAQAGVTDAMLTAEKDAGMNGLGGHFPAVRHRFKMLMVGTDEIKAPEAQVETEAHRTFYGDGLIDWRYLHAKKIWISYGTDTLFVQAAGK